MPTFDWLKAAQRFRAKTLGKVSRRDDDDDDDDMPTPTASAVVGWLPFLKPQGASQLAPA
ncbi:MAG: hypothetical protein U0235_18755 [Polyangiaceae bacterium]